MNHSFDIEIAEKYGVIEAVLYENFRHWLRHNYANSINIKDGRPWTYNSVRAYSDLFPYLSEKQIRRGIDSLVEQGALLKGEYNKANYDKTSWYSVPDLSVLAIRPNGQMDSPKRANRSARKGKPIPDINTNEKPNRKQSSPKGESQTAIDERELDNAIAYIHEKIGTKLHKDKWLRIWWFNAIKLDGLTDLKWAIKNYCESKPNLEIGKWDWISFFKIQAKRATYIPRDGVKTIPFAGRQVLHSESPQSVSDEEFAAHMAARDAG